MRGWYLTNSHFNRPRPTRHILLRHRAGAREWRRLLNRRLPEGIAKSIAVRIPQLHQEVAANRPGFPVPTIPRLFSALPRKLVSIAFGLTRQFVAALAERGRRD